MEDRDDSIKFRIEGALKRQFDEVCRQQDLTTSQVLRSMIRDYIRQYAQADLLEQRQPARRRR